MRLILGTMVAFYILVFWVFPNLYLMIFPWGGGTVTHLHPIYMGMIVISGLIVACTKAVLDKIKEIKEGTEEERKIFKD